jgi:hypothetical protein
MVLPWMLPLSKCGKRPSGTVPLLKTSARWGLAESNNQQTAPTAALHSSAVGWRCVRLSVFCGPGRRVLAGDETGWCVASNRQGEPLCTHMYRIAGFTPLECARSPNARDGIVPEFNSATALLYWSGSCFLKRFIRVISSLLRTILVECCSYPPNLARGLCTIMPACVSCPAVSGT